MRTASAARSPLARNGTRASRPTLSVPPPGARQPSQGRPSRAAATCFWRLLELGWPLPHWPPGGAERVQEPRSVQPNTSPGTRADIQDTEAPGAIRTAGDSSSDSSTASETQGRVTSARVTGLHAVVDGRSSRQATKHGARRVLQSSNQAEHWQARASEELFQRCCTELLKRVDERFAAMEGARRSEVDDFREQLRAALADAASSADLAVARDEQLSQLLQDLTSRLHRLERSCATAARVSYYTTERVDVAGVAASSELAGLPRLPRMVDPRETEQHLPCAELSEEGRCDAAQQRAHNLSEVQAGNTVSVQARPGAQPPRPPGDVCGPPDDMQSMQQELPATGSPLADAAAAAMLLPSGLFEAALITIVAAVQQASGTACSSGAAQTPPPPGPSETPSARSAVTATSAHPAGAAAADTGLLYTRPSGAAVAGRPDGATAAAGMPNGAAAAVAESLNSVASPGAPSSSTSAASETQPPASALPATGMTAAEGAADPQIPHAASAAAVARALPCALAPSAPLQTAAADGSATRRRAAEAPGVRHPALTDNQGGKALASKGAAPAGELADARDIKFTELSSELPGSQPGLRRAVEVADSSMGTDQTADAGAPAEGTSSAHAPAYATSTSKPSFPLASVARAPADADAPTEAGAAAARPALGPPPTMPSAPRRPTDSAAAAGVSPAMSSAAAPPVSTHPSGQSPALNCGVHTVKAPEACPCVEGTTRVLPTSMTSQTTAPAIKQQRDSSGSESVGSLAGQSDKIAAGAASTAAAAATPFGALAQAAPFATIAAGGRTRNVEFSPCSSYLAAGLDTGFVKVWNARTGVEEAALYIDDASSADRRARLAYEVTSFAWSADGRTLLVATLTTQCRSNGSKSAILLLRVPDKLVPGVVPQDSGRLVKLPPILTPKHVELIQGECLADAAFSPDGRTIVAATRNGCVFVWDHAPHGAWQPSDRVAFDLCLSGCDEDWRLALCRVPPGPMQQPGGSPCSAAQQNGALGQEDLWAAVGGPGRLVMWDLSARHPRDDGVRDDPCTLAEEWDASKQVMCMSSSTDGAVLASGCADGMVYIYDVRQLRPREDGRVSAHQLRPVRCFRCSSEGVTSLAVTPCGGGVLSASEDGTVQLWDIRTGRQKATLRRQGSRPQHKVVVSPDGMLAAGVSLSGEVTVWRLG